MAVQLAAGNYWKIKSIRIDPITFDVSVVVNLYKNLAGFTADPGAPVGHKFILFPNGTFAPAAITNINDSVESKLLLQPEFAGGQVVA